jgi:hypothetical protein
MATKFLTSKSVVVIHGKNLNRVKKSERIVSVPGVIATKN